MKMRKGISAVLAGVMALAALPVSAMSASAEGRMHWAMWTWTVSSPDTMRLW